MVDTLSLFEVSEALQRIEQLKIEGALLVFNGFFSGYVYCRDGLITNAQFGEISGRTALDHVINLHRSSCLWMPGVRPSAQPLKLSLRKFLIERSIEQDENRNGSQALSRKDTRQLTMPLYTHAEEMPVREIYRLVSEKHPPLELSTYGMVLGRDPGCDIVLDDPSISRRHLAVQVTKNGLLLMDLGSTNGVMLNGILIKGEAYAEHGHRVRIGEMDYEVHREQKVVGEAPVASELQTQS